MPGINPFVNLPWPQYSPYTFTMNTRTTTHLRLALVLLVLPFLAGCLRSEIRLQVRPNGTGVISYTYEMQEEFALMMIGLMTMGQEDAKPEEMVFYSLEDVKAQATTFGPGVRFVRLSPLDNPGYQGYKAEYLVPDVNNLVIYQTPTSPDGELDESTAITFSYERLSTGDAHLQVFLPLRIEPESEAQNPSEPPADLEEKKEMLEVYRGMRASIIIEPVGTIVDTTATRVQETRISVLDLDFTLLFENPGAIDIIASTETQTMDQVLGYLDGYEGVYFEPLPEISIIYR